MAATAALLNHLISFPKKVQVHFGQDSIYSNDNIAFTEVLLELQRNHYSRILILSKKEVPYEIQQKISLFDKQKIYYLIDNTLSENEIKIILEE